MKTYIVALHVLTNMIDLKDLTDILGQPGPGSHDKGGARGGGPQKSNSWKETVWKTESQCNENSALIDHLAALEPRLAAVVALRDRLPDDARLKLDIGVFYDTPYASISLPHDQLQSLIAAGADIEVTAYGSCVEITDSGD